MVYANQIKVAVKESFWNNRWRSRSLTQRRRKIKKATNSSFIKAAFSWWKHNSSHSNKTLLAFSRISSRQQSKTNRFTESVASNRSIKFVCARQCVVLHSVSESPAVSNKRNSSSWVHSSRHSPLCFFSQVHASYRFRNTSASKYFSVSCRIINYFCAIWHWG